ncbi:hypothetical protein, partial [Thermoanaerobacter siderophilus]|uniref:hypothetical protein n=1 Tax=Thermoanaerobacter siderophilus TaxID=106578 RepID=UPI000586E5F9
LFFAAEEQRKINHSFFFHSIKRKKFIFHPGGAPQTIPKKKGPGGDCVWGFFGEKWGKEIFPPFFRAP